MSKQSLSHPAISALAALSLAIQAHANAKRAERLAGPVGLFLFTIADSGERKSTCDGFFMQAIRDFEAKQVENAKPLIQEHNAALEAWKAKHAGIKEKIRSLAKTGKSAHEQDVALRDLEHNKPKSPRECLNDLNARRYFLKRSEIIPEPYPPKEWT